MAETMEIDASVVKPLAEFRQRESALREYLTRAEEAKTQVRDTVYRKVTDDYRQRLAALREQAAVLRVRVREEYSKLLREYDALAMPEEEARFAVEELQLRHLAGEIDDSQLAEGRREPGRLLEQCETRRQALDLLKAQFLDVLDMSEAQLAAEPPKETATAEAASRNEQSAERPSGNVAPPSAVFAREPSPSRTSAAVAEAPIVADSQTTSIPIGFLSIVEGPGAPAEYVLADLTYIGRGEDCHLRIVHPTISRHHAVVVGGADGFRIRDLGSQNGTLVNGEPASDRLLLDRDEILIGEALLVFSRDRSSRVG